MRSRVLAVLVLVASFLAPCYAGTLAVPVIGQEMDNWCWNASSNMVLQFNGFPNTQTDVAAWAVGGHNVPNHLSSTTVGPIAVPGDPNGTYNRQGCGLVLTNFGPVDSSYLARCLTMDEIKEEIDGDRPAILLIRWLNGGTDVGGHIIVLRGYETGDKIALADPWPADNNVHGAGTEGVAYLVDYADLFTAAGKYSDDPCGASAAIGNSWTRTLKTGRILDLCFLIDSTGSMGDDIASVKSASLSMIDDLVANYKNLRIAVVDYRDNYTDECPSCADSGDWITNVRSAFTEDANVARAAINAISTGGGNDTPEAVFSALIRTMSGSEIGEWRKDAERHIILMGDAPGHDPEPWTDGYSYADVLAYCAADPNKKFIDALLTGGDSDVETEFGGFAAATGGTMRSASGSDAGLAMTEIIEEFTATPRSPRGDVAAFRPTFTFTPPTESMGPASKNVLLEIQKLNVNAKDPNKSAWKKYMLLKLAGDATSWTPPKPLLKGDYKWRTGYVRGAGTFTFPSGTKTKVKAATLVEPNWTDFTRVEIEAATPTMFEPTTNSYTAFYPDTKDVNYVFSTVVGASSYALGISVFKESAEGGAWKLWKKVTVKPPTDPNAATITVKVKGHTIDAEYEWSVQSLNFDHPKPVWAP
jgi:hypothetical protein